VGLNRGSGAKIRTEGKSRFRFLNFFSKIKFGCLVCKRQLTDVKLSDLLDRFFENLGEENFFRRMQMGKPRVRTRIY